MRVCCYRCHKQSKRRQQLNSLLLETENLRSVQSQAQSGPSKSAFESETRPTETLTRDQSPVLQHYLVHSQVQMYRTRQQN